MKSIVKTVYRDIYVLRTTALKQISRQYIKAYNNPLVPKVIRDKMDKK